MQLLSTLGKDFLGQSIAIFMPQQQYVRGQANLPLSIHTYKILWNTAVSLSLHSHVVWFPHIWEKTLIFYFRLEIKQRQKWEKPLKFAYSPLFIVLSSLFKFGPASSAAYHSFDRYGDEWLRNEYWKGETDREFCFICACF